MSSRLTRENIPGIPRNPCILGIPANPSIPADPGNHEALHDYIFINFNLIKKLSSLHVTLHGITS